MKKIKYFNDFLNEVLIHPEWIEHLDNKNYIIISYNKYIYILDEKKLEKEDYLLKFLKELNNEHILKEYLENINYYDLLTIIREKLPNIIIFNWDLKNGNLNNIDYYVSSSEFKIDINISKQFIETLKVLRWKLFIEYIKCYESYIVYDQEQENTELLHIETVIENFSKDIEVRKLPKKIYHGTSTRVINEILKIGIRRNQKSNFKNIYRFCKYLFFTSSIIEATFYADNSARKTKSYPVILEIDSSCIDIDKVEKDYDFYVDYINQGNEYFDDLYSNQIYTESEPQLIHLHNKYIGATYRKFSYKANIYPKYITKIYFQSEINGKFDDYVEQDQFDDFLEMVDMYNDGVFEEIPLNLEIWEEEKRYLEEENE